MSQYKNALWLYPLFQIPLICCGLFLVTAALFWFLGFGRPQVAVAIALDLSGSTYSNNLELFNTPGTVVEQEIKAVQAYLTENNSDALRHPNQVRIYGFAGIIQPLTNSFDKNSQKVEQELLTAIKKPELAAQIVPDSTDINLAIDTGINALKTIAQGCRELLLVTDGETDVSPAVIGAAKLNRVKINAIVLGNEALLLRGAALATGGTYLSGNSKDLSVFFKDKFFNLFNSNWKWIFFWLGLAWISLMWMLVLPLDRWIFQGLFNMTMDTSGKLALSLALFWTVATISAIWRFWGIPFFSGC